MLSILKHKTFLQKKIQLKKFKNSKKLGCVIYNVRKYQQLNFNEFLEISLVVKQHQHQ
jgi:hypothetical protein